MFATPLLWGGNLAVGEPEALSFSFVSRIHANQNGNKLAQPCKGK